MLREIKDTAEEARSQTNVEMWEIVVDHMDRMQKHMESVRFRHDALFRHASHSAHREEAAVNFAEENRPHLLERRLLH